jgi:hypothetical protein
MAQVRVDSFILLSKCRFYAMNRREIVMKAISIPKFCFSIPSGKRLQKTMENPPIVNR